MIAEVVTYDPVRPNGVDRRAVAVRIPPHPSARKGTVSHLDRRFRSLYVAMLLSFATFGVCVAIFGATVP